MGVDSEPRQQILPKLRSLTLSYLDILLGGADELLAFLERRRYNNVVLETLDIRSCQVHTKEYILELMKLVESIAWDEVTMVSVDYEEEDDDTDTDELDDNLYKHELARRTECIGG